MESSGHSSQAHRRLERLAGQLSGGATHTVTNQSVPLSGYNAYSGDAVLTQAIERFGGGWGTEALQRLGLCAGSPEWQERSLAANRQVPRLCTHDRFGRRVDGVEFEASYHQLIGLGLEAGAASWAWWPEHRGRAGAHLIRGGLMYLMYQLNPGVCCPITMSFAALPALETGSQQASPDGPLAQVLAKLAEPSYSGADEPVEHKQGVTLGMSMTEKQGGSDVRANSTSAEPTTPGQAGPGDEFSLVGHKWFTSAPMSDGFLTLAQTAKGVSCFLVPRWLPGGRGRNTGFQLQRLKDKLGDKSNASSEVEYRGARGWMVGPDGKGVRTIVEMVVHTRLDCVIGSAALIRQAAQLAAHHCSHRDAFGRSLLLQPLMRAVLAGLSLESEAALFTWARLASALDNARTQPAEAGLLRLAVAVSKYWVCKRAPLVAYEAMECHGGNGYTEDWPAAGLFRQSPLNAIWEGSGNVICLDVLRAAGREPESLAALFGELDRASAADRSGKLAAQVEGLRRVLEGRTRAELSQLEGQARGLVDRLAVCFQAGTLLLHGDPIVAEAFVATRLPSHEKPELGLPMHNMGAIAGSVLEPQVVDRLISRLQVKHADV